MKSKILFLLSVILLNLRVGAQVILPLGTGQPDAINISCSSNDKLWVVSKVNGQFQINKWDGNFWISYRTIPADILQNFSSDPSAITAKAIYHFNGELYTTFTNAQNEILLLRSDGIHWNVINTSGIKSENNLEFISDGQSLFLCGKITVNSLLVSVLEISKTSFSVFAGSPAYMGITDYYTDFEYNNGKIWAIGLFSIPTDPSNRYFTVFDNNEWKIVTNPPYANGFEGFGKYNGRLVITGRDFDGKLSFSIENSSLTSWIEISNGFSNWSIKSVNDFQQVGKNLWISGQFVHNTSGQKASLIYWDGNSFIVPEIDYLGNDVFINGENLVYLNGSFINHEGLLLNKTGVLGFGYNIISGKVYLDPNQNCTRDNGELIVQGAAVKLLPENVFITTDFDGNYYFPVDSSVKEHFIELQLPKYRQATCGSLKYARHFSQHTISGINFGIIPEAGHTDASITASDFTGWRARQGFEERYRFCVVNTGTAALETGKIELKSDSRLTGWSFNSTPGQINNHQYTWQIPVLTSGNRYCIEGKVKIPMSISLGESIRLEARALTTDIQDEDPTDNLYVLTEKTVAGIDPNDKASMQDRYIVPGTNEMDYQIRFQNTGTDTAYNIIVTDSIDPSYVISSKGVFMDISHPDWQVSTKAWLSPSGKYRYFYAWKFNNILLPDKETNEEGSQGFVKFRLYLKEGLTLGTTVRNRAFIYFDYQEPILTNVVYNTVAVNSVNRIGKNQVIELFPNPAGDQVTIKNPLHTATYVRILNILGQPVGDLTIGPQSQTIMPLTDWPSGVYMVLIPGYDPVRLIVD